MMIDNDSKWQLPAQVGHHLAHRSILESDVALPQCSAAMHPRQPSVLYGWLL